MATDSTATTTDPIVAKLRRVQGQLGGIISMYEDDRGCIDVVQQVVAARNALGRIARDILTDEASRCSRERRLDELDAVLKELFR